MKGKIVLSVLFCFMLVFGMIFAACDNGVMPEDPSSFSISGTSFSSTGVLDFETPGAMEEDAVNEAFFDPEGYVPDDL